MGEVRWHMGDVPDWAGVKCVHVIGHKGHMGGIYLIDHFYQHLHPDWNHQEWGKCSNLLGHWFSTKEL